MSVLINSSWENFIQLFGVLLIFVAVLMITYLTTRWMGGFQKQQSKNRNLNIVETIRVGNNKMICIVRAGSKYLVVSIGKDEVNVLCELADDEVQIVPEDNIGFSVSQESFQEILNRLKDKLPKK